MKRTRLPRASLKALSAGTAGAVAIGSLVIGSLLISSLVISSLLISSAALGAVAAAAAPAAAPPTTLAIVNGKQMESLDRGVISVRSGSGNLVTWRLLADDPSGTSFNVYRSGAKITSTPVTASTNYLD